MKISFQFIWKEMSFDFANLNYELTKIVDQNMDLRFQKFLDEVKKLDDSLDDKFLKLAWSKAGEIDGIPANATCPYVPSRGKNKGIECGGKRRIGGKYCSAHRKYEGKEVGKDPSDKNSEKTSRSSSVASRTVGTVGGGKKAEQDRRIRPHFELGKLWHSQSSLTFEVGTDGARVDGKIVDGVLKDLTPSDLDTVYLWQFPIDPELEKKLKGEEEEVEEKDEEKAEKKVEKTEVKKKVEKKKDKKVAKVEEKPEVTLTKLEKPSKLKKPKKPVSDVDSSDSD